jgi:hypothetical protein
MCPPTLAEELAARDPRRHRPFSIRFAYRINGEYWPPEKGARLMIDNHDDSDEIDL